MSEISAAIGFNLIVISPTIALVGTALVLLFFTITIESNEIVALQGPSGAGKTTLLKSIGLLDTIDSGSIIFEQKNIT